MAIDQDSHKLNPVCQSASCITLMIIFFQKVHAAFVSAKAILG
jgi:hypothetical protein